MRKSLISFSDKNHWWKGDTFEDDLIDLSIRKAYRDLARTIRGFSKHPYHDEILKKARESLHGSISKILSISNINQQRFDEEHLIACDQLIKSFENQLFTYGQAQKWINMAFKYLNLLDYEPIQKVYEYCHVPIDSYMLEETDYHKISSWSTIKNYDVYMKYQLWFRNKYCDKIPLDAEYFLWLEGAKKHKTN